MCVFVCVGAFGVSSIDVSYACVCVWLSACVCVKENFDKSTLSDEEEKKNRSHLLRAIFFFREFFSFISQKAINICPEFSCANSLSLFVTLNLSNRRVGLFIYIFNFLFATPIFPH